MYVIQLEEQADDMQAQGERTKRRQQAFVGDAALRKAQSLVSGGASVEECGGCLLYTSRCV